MALNHTTHSSPLPSPYVQRDTSSTGNKISPALLITGVLLSVIVFISGLIYFLYKFLIKSRTSSLSQSNRHLDLSISSAFQRQLHQLFNLHDSGLDQAFIDALPVFIYKDLMGDKEPFDCAVCLCEFSKQDKLRLLPLCSHAFHMECIDTWLLSNSTCPLCRGVLFTPGFSMENPVYDFDYPRYEDGLSGRLCISIQGDSKSLEGENSSIVGGKRVLSVRLGKYIRTNGDSNGEGEVKEVGETSNSSTFDARRCFSMGSFQYVVANSDLQVEWSQRATRIISNNNADENGDEKVMQVSKDDCGNSPNDKESNDKKISVGAKGESFSLSKIWLWSKKDRRNSHFSDSVNVSLPRLDKSQVV
ncbi:ubiquitin-protein ligase [Lithospermum erythrorhizon]|uniref:RING-type E3 ubiquitin transferase n=1 Tax=Lithospermum erythrorhizon TaxID=34254 RepID=A0AAV3PIQ4_LITER